MDKTEKRREEGRKEGIICPKCFVLISSVGKPLNTVLSRQRKMGKQPIFPAAEYCILPQ